MKKNSQSMRYRNMQEVFNPKTWKAGKEDLLLAGKKDLMEEVNNLESSLVIDAGCGHNVFKGKIKNLIGFDISNFPNADFVSSIQDAEFENESADVVLALGSVQFGNKTDVYEDVAKLVSWVKPGGYIVMRARMDQNFLPLDKRNSPRKSFQYFWSEDDINFLSEKHNLSIVKGPRVKESPAGKENEFRCHRLFWWWSKNV